MTTKLKLQFFLIYLLCFVNSLPLFSQSINFFCGKIINSETWEPLPFATIVLKENNIGEFSNANGEFLIANNPKFQSDSIIITFVGFKRTAISFNNLREDKVNNIYLNPINIQLSEVEVVAKQKKINSETIIRKAIRNISENCPNKPFNYISYYRDYQKKDKNYINLNEAIVQTLDNGFKKSSLLNKYRLLDFRQNTDFQRMNISPYYDTIPSTDYDNPNKFIQSAKLPDQGGNELFILMIHDPIRNFKTETFSFINRLYNDFISNHIFSEIAPVYNHNLLLYKISFTAKKELTGDSLLVTGNIYIQPGNYSIHKFEYSGSYLLKGNVKKKMFDVVIEYGHEDALNSLMRLKYISFNNIFNIVDVADTTYFRITKSQIDPNDQSNSTIILEFNNNVDKQSACNKDYYEIFIDGKKAKILSITVKGNNAILRINPEKNTPKIKPRIEVTARDIRDINGKILNVKKNLEFDQYRELFVQEFKKPLSFKDSCYMQNLPLFSNCISKYNNDPKYWMNTPENIKTGIK